MGALIFSIPSTGFQDIVIKYATVRSGSGAHFQNIYYTTDGEQYVLYGVFEVNTSVEQKEIKIDLTSITAAHNNPKLKIKITFGMGGGGLAGNNRFDNFTVESIPVSSETVKGVRISTKDTILEEGSAFQLTAQVLPENAINKGVVWSSTSSGIATVDSFGMVSALKAGITMIKVSTVEGAFEDSCIVTVNFSSKLELLYFWHFNDITSAHDITEILSDFSFSSNTGKLTYTQPQFGERDIDRFTPGTVLNARSNIVAGAAARVRNPSFNRSLLFDVPTNGMKDILLSFAIQRSSNGMIRNIVEYALDGVNFTSFGLENPIKTVEHSESWQVFSIDFSTIQGANNNPFFKIRITWDGNTTNNSGNNRYDNIVLMGNALHVSSHQLLNESPVSLFPNPCESEFSIILPSSLRFKKAYVFNLLGGLEFESVQTSINTTDLSIGVFLVCVETHCGKMFTQRLVKASN